MGKRKKKKNNNSSRTIAEAFTNKSLEVFSTGQVVVQKERVGQWSYDGIGYNASDIKGNTLIHALSMSAVIKFFNQIDWKSVLGSSKFEIEQRTIYPRSPANYPRWSGF
mgnify:FL=1|tara:strand:- start:638 stop:964 length:327 start_codon:yes stop_codon:yes gene_type:complete